MNIRALFDRDTWQQYMTTVWATFQRFPLALLFCFMLAGTLIVLIGLPYDAEEAVKETVERLALAASFGIFLSVCLHMAAERMDWPRPYRYVLMVAAVLMVATYHLRVLDVYDTYEVGLRHGLILAGLAFLFFLIPYLPDRRPFPLYVIQMAERFLVTTAYTIVLGAGLSAILFAVENLLYEALNNDLYGQFWVLAVTVFAPLYYLSGVPRKNERLSVEVLGKAFRGLLTYILIPLLTAYTLVLYLYFIRILVSLGWPSGIVSYLVIFYAFVGILTLFFLMPVLEEKSLTRRFAFIFPKAIYPLLIMMFVAIFMRIGQYGFTENRYFIMVAGFWLTFTYTWFNLSKKRNGIIPVAVLVILFGVVSIGPLSAFSVSVRSQNNRFMTIAQEANLLDAQSQLDGTKDVSELSDEKLIELFRIVEYFQRYHETKDLKVLPLEAAEKEDPLQYLYGVTRPKETGVDPPVYFAYYRDESKLLPRNITGYDVHMRLHRFRYAEEVVEGSFEHKGHSYRVEITDAWQIEIFEDERLICEYDLQADLMDYAEKHVGEIRKESSEDWVIRCESDQIQLMLSMLQADIRLEGPEEDQGIHGFSGDLFLKIEP